MRIELQYVYFYIISITLLYTYALYQPSPFLNGLDGTGVLDRKLT